MQIGKSCSFTSFRVVCGGCPSKSVYDSRIDRGWRKRCRFAEFAPHSCEHQHSCNIHSCKQSHHQRGKCFSRFHHDHYNYYNYNHDYYDYHQHNPNGWSWNDDIRCPSTHGPSNHNVHNDDLNYLWNNKDPRPKGQRSWSKLLGFCSFRQGLGQLSAA